MVRENYLKMLTCCTGLMPLCMYMYVCTCMYVCVCTCMYVGTCVYACTCMYVHICRYTYVCTYMYVRTCMCVHVCTYMYVCRCMYRMSVKSWDDNPTNTMPAAVTTTNWTKFILLPLDADLNEELLFSFSEKWNVNIREITFLTVLFFF